MDNNNFKSILTLTATAITVASIVIMLFMRIARNEKIIVHHENNYGGVITGNGLSNNHKYDSGWFTGNINTLYPHPHQRRYKDGQLFEDCIYMEGEYQ